jgi:hypothetical protein
MENSFQTSFIPKKPIDSSASSKEPVSLFLIISIFLLVVSAAASAGLYFYKIYLVKQRDSSSASLSSIRDSFEKSTIDDLDLFNKKTDIANKILNNHIVFSPMFNLLGDITIPAIQYTKFEQENVNGTFYVKMEGLAKDYKSIAIQADIFNGERGQYFKNVIFSNLTKDKTNNISFNLEFDVDPILLSYIKNSSLSKVTDSNNPIIPTNPLPQGVVNPTQ